MSREQQAKPLYQTVVETIQQQIEAGDLKPDEKIPSESELCSIHAVGRNTVRRAISELVNASILRTVPGVGTFVVNRMLDKSADYLLGFTHEMQLRGKKVTSRVLDAKIIHADPLLSRRLQIQLGAEVVYLNRVRLMDGEPTALERAYLPHQLCPGILAYDFALDSLYEILTSIYRKVPDHAEQVIEAGIATSDVSELLGLAPPAVVLMFHRETRLANGQVIEYVDSELRGDRFRFYTNLQLQASSTSAAFQMLPLQLAADAY